jgi:uncharacterized membrane protein YfcA
MTPAALGLVCLGVLLGALAHRLTGFGFTLVAAPILVTVIGPVDGIILCLLLNAGLAGLVLISTWRFVLWSRLTHLSLGCVAGTSLGAVLVAILPGSILTAAVGVLTVVAVGAALSSTPPRLFVGRRGSLITGLISGSMNATAGTGGPILAVHSLADKWPPIAFIGTVQIYFIGANALALLMRGPVDLPIVVWFLSFFTLTVGAVAGHFLARLITRKAAFRLVVILSFTGGLALIAKGLWALIHDLSGTS